MVILTHEELNIIIRKANDMGHNDIRVLSITEMPISGSSDPLTRFAWIADGGPISATQIWEDR